MAKQCDICKQSYPDHDESCPHCAESVKVLSATHLASLRRELDSGIGAGAPVDGGDPSAHNERRHTHSDVEIRPPDSVAAPDAANAPRPHSEVDLSVPAETSENASNSRILFGETGDPVSGHSSVAWASLVEEKGPDLLIDSPSDVDMLRFVEQPAAPIFGVSALEPPQPPKTEETSAVDLAGPTKDPVSGTSGSGSLPPASGLRLVTDAIEEDFEGVLVRGDGPETGKPAPPVKTASKYHMPLASESDFAPDEDEMRKSAANVDLSAPPRPLPTERPSGRDLIAEAVESGVDLLKEKAPADVPDDLVLHRSKPGEGDSAVDLGAPGAVVDSEHDVFAGKAEATASMVERAGDLDLGSIVAVSGKRLGDDNAPSILEEKPAARATPTKPDKSVKPPKSRSAAVGWVGTGVVGALAGAGICVTLWLLGLIPGTDAKKTITPNPNPGANTGNAGGNSKTPASLETALADLRGGDIDKALPVLEAAGEEPERLAARGEARWLSYLKQQKGKKLPLKADDELVQRAREDLSKANTADAVLWLGHIEETVGNPDSAKEIYQDGMKRFPKEKLKFQAALDCLEVNGDEWKQRGARRATPDEALADARQMALLMTALQADKPAGDEAERDEAGYLFWSAAKLAKNGNYAEAVKTLDNARSLHDQKRFDRIRKAQNPNSDPNEEIFLKSCTELKTYWEIAQMLKDKGYPVAPKQTIAAAIGASIDASQKNLSDLKAINVQLVKDAATEKKLSEETITKLNEALIKEKASFDKERTEAKTLSAKQAELILEASNKLKAISARIEEAGIQNKDPVKGIDELVAARVDADAKLTEVGKKLEEGKFIAPKATSTDILKGVDRVVGLAKANDPQGQLSAVKQELQRAQDALSQRHSPEEMVSIWLPVVNERSHREIADKALADADRVLKDDKASAAAKAQAKAVQGLALRDQTKFDAARVALEQALKDGAKDAAWYATARTALQELTDPNAFYGSRAEHLHAAGRYPAALAMLTQGLLVFPKDQGRLLALRAVVRLDQVRDQHKGKVPVGDPAVNEIRKDVDAAVAAGGGADGHYAAGRLAEELGNIEDARQSYQRALEAKGGNRVRLALARVLLKAPAVKGSAEQGEPNANWGVRVAALAPSSPANGIRYALAAPAAGREEADRLADEVIANTKDDPEGLILKAQAYAIKGLWTKAMTTYVDGLRPHIRGEDADAMLDIIDNHPALKRPDSLKTPNPSMAAQRYSSGLRLYYEGRYGDAEKEFTSAVENDSLDARFFYYLGLSRIALDNRAAAVADFEQAANLERLHRPDKATVNAALERVQGPPRQEMNRYRP